MTIEEFKKAEAFRGAGTDAGVGSSEAIAQLQGMVADMQTRLDAHALRIGDLAASVNSRSAVGS